jgi:CHASE3 domain sensor protein
MKCSIEKQSLLGFGTASVVLIIIHALSYWSFVEQRRTSAWVTHTHVVLEKLETTLSDIKDAETAQRGYVITGRERYLEPYQSVVNSIHPQIEELKNLTADNPNQQQRLHRFDPLVAQKLAIMSQIIELRTTEGFLAAQQMIQTDWGTELMERIRLEVHEIQAEENKLLKQRLERELTAAHRQNLFSTVVIVADLLLFYWVYQGLNREIARRKQAEATVLFDN